MALEIEVIDPSTNELVALLYPEYNCCDQSPPCGGCDDCLTRQAMHYGFTIKMKDRE